MELIRKCLLVVVTLATLIVFVWPMAVLTALNWVYAQATGKDTKTNDRLAYWSKYEKGP